VRRLGDTERNLTRVADLRTRASKLALAQAELRLLELGTHPLERAPGLQPDRRIDEMHLMPLAASENVGMIIHSGGLR
jgi:hypothetical protein